VRKLEVSPFIFPASAWRMLSVQALSETPNYEKHSKTQQNSHHSTLNRILRSEERGDTAAGESPTPKQKQKVEEFDDIHGHSNRLQHDNINIADSREKSSIAFQKTE